MKNRDEKFVTIKGFPNYTVSDKGKVMSYVNSEDGRLLKPQKDSQGYVHVRLYDNTDIRGYYSNGQVKPKLEKVHRLVAMHFLPEPDLSIYHEVNHIDGNKLNNAVTNLEWMTRKENINHAWKIGLNEKGRSEGAVKRRKSVKVIHSDGRVEYYQGRIQAAFHLGVTPLTIIKKIKSGTIGKTGFKAEDIEFIPEEEFYVSREAVEEKIRAWNWRYYSVQGKEKRLQEKLDKKK